MTEAGASVLPPAARGDFDTAGDARRIPLGQELHDELRRRGDNIGLTTGTDAAIDGSGGMVDTLRTDTGESVYRRCSEHHHTISVPSLCSTVEVGAMRSRSGRQSRRRAWLLRRQSHHRDLWHCSDCRR